MPPDHPAPQFPLDEIRELLGSRAQADWFYDRLKDAIEESVALVEAPERIGVYAGSPFGTLQVVELGYSNPQMITMSCRGPDGTSYFLMAHMATVQVILRKELPEPPDAPERPIGFVGDRHRGVPKEPSSD